jgi:hypothetical protein
MMDGLCDCNVCMPFDYYQQTVARWINQMLLNLG